MRKVLSYDEIKIKQGLVFDIGSDIMIGFVHTEDVNSKLKSFKSIIEKQNRKQRSEREDIADHILMIYIRGIIVKLEYPLVQFPTTSIIHVIIFSLLD
jgi:hypothetical protein